MKDRINEILKAMNDTFEAEINAQEFAIDEAEWAGLIKALKVAQTNLTAQIEQLLVEARIEEVNSAYNLTQQLLTEEDDSDEVTGQFQILARERIAELEQQLRKET